MTPSHQPQQSRNKEHQRQRDLERHRPTQLSFSDAVRAREVATPTPSDLASAEAELKIVRKNYVPSESLPGNQHHPHSKKPGKSPR